MGIISLLQDEGGRPQAWGAGGLAGAGLRGVIPQTFRSDS